jgi:hypothetical protein
MKQVWIVVISVCAAAMGICAIAWWFWPTSENRHVANVKRLTQQIFEQRESLSDSQRQALFQQVRGEMDQLSEPERQQLRREMSSGFRDRMNAQIKKFHSLPADQRTSFLDEQIDRMESIRRQAGARLGPGRGGWPGASRGGQDDGRPPAPGQGREWGGRQAGRWNLSQEQRDQRRRERLDGSTARERAEFVAYIEAMRERRKQRGLPDFGPRWR